MSMDSSKIKAIITHAKLLPAGEANPEDVIQSMVNDMTKSPTFAVAIIQHLKNKGVDLMAVECEAAETFRDKFLPQIEKLGEREFTQIQKISQKLFG